MCGHVDPSDGLKVRMAGDIQLIGKKALHTACTKFTGGQTDIMNHEEID
jgi:hypothetical protein